MNGDLTRELRLFLRELAEEEGLKLTAFEVVKGGAMAGAGAIVGGLLLGPFGLFVGSTVMGGVASLTCKNFQPLHQVLAEMPEHRWRHLENRVQRIMQNRGVLDVIGLAALAVAGSPLRDQVVLELMNFAQNELGKNVIRE